MGKLLFDDHTRKMQPFIYKFSLIRGEIFN